MGLLEQVVQKAVLREAMLLAWMPVVLVYPEFVFPAPALLAFALLVSVLSLVV